VKNRTNFHRVGEASAMSFIAATQFEKERGVTQIRVTPDIVHFCLKLPRGGGMLREIRALADTQVPVFLVKLIPGGLTFAVRAEHVVGATALLERRGVEFTTREQMALVSVIAGAMRDLSGVMADIYEALQQAQVAIRQTGDRYDAVHILVDGSEAERAREALAHRFDQAGGV
jgi:aspartate kinase